MQFYELSRLQRLEQLQHQGILSSSSAHYLLQNETLSESRAVSMSENVIGQFSLPYGVADNFVINGRKYFVPMVTEEPSVIAAASNGAKRVKSGGGFRVIQTQHLIKAQLIMTGVADYNSLQLRINAIESQLYQVAEQAHPSIVQRGGGLKSWQLLNTGHDFAELVLVIDPCAAFGANLANTIAEGVGHYLSQSVLQTDEQVLAAILSNSGEQMLTTVQAVVPVTALATKAISGLEVAKKISQLNKFSQLNHDRAVTENKGVLNGIFAVALATGNDLRAISVAVDDYLINAATPNLTTWQLDLSAENLIGKLTLPLPIGRVGGAINSLPLAQISLEILQQPKLEELMGIVASVGLANNLAALRALVSTGIQAGHMHLQQANLAIQAGASDREIPELTKRINQLTNPNLNQAQQLLETLRRERSPK